ncbi:hypothetical protein RIF29_09359 [Crotalaria pallida]|uniref:Uncharacterized protein n=1 Tax=Crotalaria pallida TaxID=3830 RepID=A0AAN9FY07_CROPI
MVGDNKKLKVEDNNNNNNSDDDASLDPQVLLSIEKLQEIRDQLDKINEEASDEVLEIEKKYNEIRKPVYDKRNEIIKSIPDFWLTAFLNHPALGELLNDEDQKIFKYLDSLEVEDHKDVKSGFTITFGIPNGVNHEKKGNKRALVDVSFFSWFSDGEDDDDMDDIHDEVAELIKDD